MLALYISLLFTLLSYVAFYLIMKNAFRSQIPTSCSNSSITKNSSPNPTDFQTSIDLSNVVPVDQIGPGCLTAASFAALQSGMTLGQVVAIAGQPSAEIANSEIAGFKTVMYQWNAGGAIMNVMFQNGRLVSKAQFGLR